MTVQPILEVPQIHAVLSCHWTLNHWLLPTPISCYRLATCFTENFKIIAVKRNTVSGQNAPQAVWWLGSAQTRCESIQLSTDIAGLGAGDGTQ